jgi:hypothetical protein
VSAILVFCRRCGKQVPSPETRDGNCLDCRVSVSLDDLRKEHARLWRKRERYRGRAANLDSIARQIARVEDRMAERIVALVPSQEKAAEHLRRELEAARQARYDIR